ncbi:3-dehydroquinate synthase, partial [Dissostichus eleginoides]
VEKLNTLGYRAMVFLSKPGKKPSTWKTNVAHPRWHLSDQAAKCIDRMKALYEVLVD